MQNSELLINNEADPNLTTAKWRVKLQLWKIPEGGGVVTIKLGESIFVKFASSEFWECDGEFCSLLEPLSSEELLIPLLFHFSDRVQVDHSCITLYRPVNRDELMKWVLVEEVTYNVEFNCSLADEGHFTFYGKVEEVKNDE